jgi:hypothetical protein
MPEERILYPEISPDSPFVVFYRLALANRALVLTRVILSGKGIDCKRWRKAIALHPLCKGL